MRPSHPTSSRRDLIRAAWLVGSGTLLGAAVFPPLFSAGRSTAARQVDTDPTKTREAELEELSDLRTRVAQPALCTPAPNATPVPATATATPVPAVAAGLPITYADRFTITVLGIAPVPAGGGVETQGQLLRVNLTILNTTANVLSPPFADWQLVDATGQPYRLSREASDAVAGGWALPTRPGVSEDRAVVFDVLPTAGIVFTLESRDEPTFRVTLSIESRG